MFHTRPHANRAVRPCRHRLRAPAGVFRLGRLTFLTAVATLVLAPAATAAADEARTVGAPVDIMIAIDGTGSMGPTIERAKREGRAIMSGVRGVLPNTRFAVAVVRDFGNSLEEYELLQPLTADQALVDAALARIRTGTNQTAENGPAESYNLLFRMSYTDRRLGWRPNARKLVVVVGDAEPQSAGRLGLVGCVDTARDQHGLNTLTELAGMRAAGRTLLMLRVPSATSRPVTLRCYESLAARAAPGGAAIEVGGDLVSPIVALAQRSLAPITVRSSPASVRPGATVRLTVTISNATGGVLRLEQVALRLPAQFAYRKGSTRGAITRNPRVAGSLLVWPLGRRAMRPSEVLRVQVAASVTARRTGRYRGRASAIARTSSGERLTTASLPYGIAVDARRPTRVR